MCDGAITNMSESIMNKYNVGQDEFIFRMYSVALIAIIAAAATKGDLRDGMIWILQPGTYDEQLHDVPLEDRKWSSGGKIAVMILFSSMGFFGSSCAAAITKHFGALSMSITSVSRKATTLFLSFLLFDNECTYQHVLGIMIFISALAVKSIRRKNKKRKSYVVDRRVSNVDLELGGGRGNSGKLSRVSSKLSYDSSDSVETTSTGGSTSRRKRNDRRKNVSPMRSNEQRSRYRVV
jgi:hypothetical protein